MPVLLTDGVGRSQQHDNINRLTDSVIFRPFLLLGNYHQKIMQKAVEVMVVLNTLNSNNDTFINRLSENVESKINVVCLGVEPFFGFDLICFYLNARNITDKRREDCFISKGFLENDLVV